MHTNQLRPNEKIIFKTEAAMQMYKIAQSYPGFIILTNERIFWKAVGMLSGSEVDNSFDLRDIKGVTCGTAILSYRLVISLKNGDNVLFNQLDKKEAKAFVEAFNQIKK